METWFGFPEAPYNVFDGPGYDEAYGPHDPQKRVRILSSGDTEEAREMEEAEEEARIFGSHPDDPFGLNERAKTDVSASRSMLRPGIKHKETKPVLAPSTSLPVRPGKLQATVRMFDKRVGRFVNEIMYIKISLRHPRRRHILPH